MPINIVVRSEGAPLAQVQHVLNQIHDELMRPDPTRAVKRVAEVWGISYKMQGSAVGGWTALAQSTIDERVRQGFGTGPILRRSGSLYNMAIDFFQAGNPGRATSYSNYGGRSIATTATLNIADGTATLGLSGPKTVHQTGKHRPPQRQYWFTTRESTLAARLGVIEWINKEVMEKWNKS